MNRARLDLDVSEQDLKAVEPSFDHSVNMESLEEGARVDIEADSLGSLRGKTDAVYRLFMLSKGLGGS